MNRPLFSLTARTLFAGAFAVCLVATAGATTYYWKGATGSGGYGDWSDLSNWSTAGANGANAAAAPGPTDKFYGQEHRSINLEGQEWSIGGWDSTGDWNRHKMYLTNGTLNVVGDVTTHSDDIHLSDAKIIFAEKVYGSGSTAIFTPAENDAGEHRHYIHSGGEVDIFGMLRIYKYYLYVESGGTAVIAPAQLYIRNNNSQQSFFQNDGGTLSMPNGLVFGSGSTSAGFRFSLIQNSGTLELGGPVSKGTYPGDFRVILSGGTIHATGDISFDFSSATVSAGQFVMLDVDAGASIDLSSFTYGAGAAMTKTGAGDFIFENGMALPDSFVVSAGAVSLGSSGSYDLSGITFDINGKVKIGAAGITLTAWDNSLPAYGGFVTAIASPIAGSTVLTCADAALLAKAQAGINATLPEGFAVRIEGNSLVVTSAYVFNSTTVTDLCDPAGWAGGSVPSNKVVTIMGAGVAPVTADLPPFAGITIQDGASLTIANGGTLPALTLADSAALTISSGTATLGGGFSAQPSGNAFPTLTVASGATLNVPGETTFTDCSLSVSGTLAATTAGDLVLGHAAAGATASFGLTVNGGTLSTTAGDIRFFCPASGGTVTPLSNVSFTGATFSHDNDHGFQFGVNNPSATAITFTFDNTTLNYPKIGNYYISGGSALRFVNGGSLWRDNNQNDASMLYVNGLASIYLGPGTSSLFGESSQGGSVGNGRMVFSPDTDGHVALTLDGATWETYHSASSASVSGSNSGANDTNGKAVTEIFGASLHTINQDNWNRTMPFSGFKEVHLNNGATLSISNDVDLSAITFSEKFTGDGSLFFSTPRSTMRTFNWNGTDSTATGTLSADATRLTKLLIAPTATWGGTVVWNAKAEIDHSSTADAMTFGGIDLVEDFTWRIWGDGTCDHYTLTGAGFLDNGGKAVIVVADVLDADVGDSWTLARVPAGSYVPVPASSSSWAISTRAVEGDDSVVDLVLAPVASDFVFDSTEVTDFSSAAGWSCGYVPTNENVKVSGEGVVAIISDAATFPAIASIAVRDGATLRVLADVTLPPLTLDSTATLLIGDNGAKPSVAATFDASLITSYHLTNSTVALPVIEVATNASLCVAAGMKFKNVDFRLYGTVTKVGTDTAAPTFGFAESGETSYIAFTAEGGTFDFHANNNERDYGSVLLVRPASGGTVIPVGPITLRNALRNVTGWADFGSWEFGVNNPTNVPFDVLVDGTRIDVSGDFTASGAAHLSLVNGSFVRRNSSCIGHWFPMAIQYSATITVGEGCYIDFTTNNGQFGIDSQMAVDTVTVRDGGAYTVSQNSSGYVRGVFVSDGGILGVTKKSTRDQTDLLRGFGSARLDGDLTIQSINIGTGSTDWNRHTTMANIPFTGTGDVIVTNGVPAYPFTVTMQNGTSTATGAIRVNRVEGDAETALYFANGANWAGTVVAGDVALTNLTDGAAAAAVSFGALDLAADFPVRVWGDGTCDHYTLTGAGFLNNGGKAVIVVADGSEVGADDSWTIARVPAGTALPTPAGSSWTIAAVSVAGDDSVVDLVLSPVVSDNISDSITATYPGVLPTSQTVLFTNANLLAVRGLSLDGYQKFGSQNDTHTYTNFEGEASTGAPTSGYYTKSGLFGYTNDGSVLTVEFHGINTYGPSYNGTGNGFELKLTQVGTDIRGEVTWMAGFTGANDYENSSWESKKKSNFNDWDSPSATYSTGGYNLTLYFVDVSHPRTVTFIDKDGATIDTVVVPAGQLGATAPTPPAFSNFVFAAWDKDFAVVKEDMTITALYHAFFTVRFLDADGTVLSTQTVEETTSATAPVMTGCTYGGYPFAGWSADFSSVSGNMDVTAQYGVPPAHVPAAIAAGNLPTSALIWCGDSAKAWDDHSFNWYTTAGLRVRWTDDAVAVFATSGVVRVSGPKDVGGFVVALGADVTLSGDALSLASCAEAIFNSDGSLSVSNDVACADDFVQRVRDAHDVLIPGTAHSDEIEGNLSSELQLLFSGISLADIEYIQGQMTGVFGNATKTLTLSSNGAASSDGGVFFYANDGTTLTAQFQIKSYNTCRNCIKVQLVQVGNDIYGQIAYQKSGYTNGSNPPPALGTNWDDYTGNGYSQSICDLVVGVPDKTIYDTLPTNIVFETAGDFSLTGTLVVSNGVFQVVDDGTLCGGNFTANLVTWNDGTVLLGSSSAQALDGDIQGKGTGEVRVLAGSTVAVRGSKSMDRAWRFVVEGTATAKDYRALPASSGGSATVLPGGELALADFYHEWGPSGSGAPLVVQTNGLLRLTKSNSIGLAKPIYLEGGTMTNEVSEQNLLFKTYLRDGARVTGKGYQVGLKKSNSDKAWSFIDVGGVLPSLIDAESLMVGYQYPAGQDKPIGVKFIVADVTGDVESDLVVASPITEMTGATLFDEGYRENLGVWKQGPGTIEFTSPANACTTGVFKVEAGTVRLGEGCGGNFGALIVLGDAVIDCAGGAIAFEDSADMEWTAGATLRITGNFNSRTIRVGTDSSSLTAEQLSAIAYVNTEGRLYPVTLSRDGYLLPPPSANVETVHAFVQHLGNDLLTPTEDQQASYAEFLSTNSIDFGVFYGPTNANDFGLAAAGYATEFEYRPGMTEGGRVLVYKMSDWRIAQHDAAQNEGLSQYPVWCSAYIVERKSNGEQFCVVMFTGKRFDKNSYLSSVNNYLSARANQGTRLLVALPYHGALTTDNSYSSLVASYLSSGYLRAPDAAETGAIFAREYSSLTLSASGASVPQTMLGFGSEPAAIATVTYAEAADTVAVSQIVGAHGSVSNLVSQIVPGVATPFAIVADPGYVVAQVVTNGATVAGVLGETSVAVDVLFSNAQEATNSVVATFAPANAWYLDPFVRNRFLSGADTENTQAAAIDEAADMVAFGTSPGYSTAGIVQYALSKMTNDFGKVTAYEYAKTESNSHNGEYWGCDFAAVPSFEAIVSCNYVNNDVIVSPYGGPWIEEGDVSYTVPVDMGESGLAVPNLYPITVNKSGTFLYGTDKDGDRIYKFAIVADPQAANKIGSLQYVASWDFTGGGNLKGIGVGIFNGNDVVYMAKNASRGLWTLDIATGTLTKTDAAIAGEVYQIFPTGLANGTPRLVVAGGDSIYVFSLAADGSLLTPVPVFHCATAEFSLRSGSSLRHGVAPLDDESRVVIGYSATNGKMEQVVLEKKPENLIVRGTFDDGTTVHDFDVAFGDPASVTFNAPAGQMIAAVAVNGVDQQVADYAESYTYENACLEQHVYVSMTASPDAIPLDSVTVAEGTYVYRGTAWTPDVAVRAGGYALREGVHYTLVWTNNVNAGTATVVATGIGPAFAGSVTNTFAIAPRALSESMFSLASFYPFTGDEVRPAVTVVEATLTSNDWEVVAFTNNVAPGTAAVIIAGKRNFTGTAMPSFDIACMEQYVSTTGDDSSYGATADTPKRTLQAAVDAAYAGAVVYVSEGVYAPVSTGDKAIRVIATAGPGKTVIDGGGTNRCVTAGSAYEAVFSGFTIRNGNQSWGNGQNPGGGGVFYGEYRNCVIENCRTHISSYGYGGGAFRAKLVNCLLKGNTANAGGGARDSTLINCTVVGNRATNWGGGGVDGGTIQNSIVWGNYVNNSNSTYISTYNHNGGTFSYSCTSPSMSGAGNVSDDPRFVEPANEDYRLLDHSPCIDAGSTAYDAGATDLEGNPRIAGAMPDMGCYEGAVELPAPGTPQGFSAEDGRRIGFVRLAWSETDWAWSYAVERASDSTFADAHEIGTTTALFFDDTNAVPETVYWYRVRGVNPEGSGEPSSANSGSCLGPLAISAPTLGTGTARVPIETVFSATGGAGGYVWRTGADDYTVSRTPSSWIASEGESTGVSGDDACRVWPLPFDFPFYGSSYDKVWVNSNGELSFDGEWTSYAGSESALRPRKAIAVFWKDLRTGGAGVTVTANGSESISFHWQNCTYYSGGGAVNASVTLFADGTIVCSYGGGNASGAFIGISAGDNTRIRCLALSGTSMANADDIVFTPQDLPAGLSLASDGTLSGTPEAAGTYAFTLFVTDANGNGQSRLVTLEVEENPNVRIVTFDLGGQGTRVGGGTLVQGVLLGASAVAPTVRATAGWVFDSWNGEFGNVQSDVTVTARWRPAMPALRVTDVAAPSSANAGDEVMVSWMLTNWGNAAVSGTMTEQVRFVSATNAALASTVATVAFSGEIARDGTATRSATFSLPEKGLEGDWFVEVVSAVSPSVQLHATGVTARSPETLTIAAIPLPNIVVTDIGAPALLVPGGVATISYTVRNDGAADAASGWTDEIHLVSEDSGAEVKIATIMRSGALASGASRTETAEIVIPETVPLAGVVRVKVVADSGDAVIETDDVNGVLSATVSDLSLRLFLSAASASVSEANQSVRFIMRRSGPTTAPLPVALTGSPAGQLTVPASATIPKGSASANITIHTIDNSVVDGPRTATVVASADGFAPVSASITVTDNETPHLFLSLSGETVREGRTLSGTVRRELVTDQPLTVNLAGPSTSRCSYPSSVTIAAGEASAAFEIAIPDNETAQQQLSYTLHASASGHSNATANFTIEDDDVPGVVLTLYPEIVSEGAGANAVYATLTRADLADKIDEAIRVRLSHTPSGNLILPSEITIPQYTAAVRFAVGTVDNSLDEGDRDVTIDGAVVIESCGCNGQPSSGDAIRAMMSVIDDDGPALSLKAEPATMKEGLDEAGVLILSHNSTLTENLTVALTFDTEGEIDIPSTATIPAGSSSVRIPVRTLDDGVEDGAKLVSVYATDESGIFAPASTWVQVSDQNLPDLTVSLVAAPAGVVAMERFAVVFSVTNAGFMARSGAIPYAVHLVRGANSATVAASTLQASGSLTGGIAVDGTLSGEAVLTAPEIPGDCRVAVVIDPDGTISELDSANNTGWSAVVSVSAAYTAEVVADAEAYLPGEAITITGLATLAGGSPACGVPVDVYLLRDSYRKTLSATTAADGTFTASFTPSSGECGHYRVGACYPGVGSSAEQDSFDVMGMKRTSSSNVIWDYALGDSALRTVTLKNLSAAPLTGLAAQFEDVPAACSLEYTLPDTIPGNGNVTLSMTATAVGVTEGVDYERFRVHLTTDQGVALDLPLYFHSQTQKAYLRATPTSINTTMAVGSERTLDIVVYNDGKGDSGAVTATVPSASWLSIIGGASVDNLASGESMTVTLLLAPQASDNLALNNPLSGGRLAVNCANGTGCSVSLKFTPVSEATGSVVVDAADNNTFTLESAPHLAGATVRVTNPYTGALVASGTTGTNGLWTASDIPEGRYQLTVTAPKHDTYADELVIEPGATTHVTAFLQYKLVTFTWDVQKTDVEDEYDIKLVADYETHVPAPLVKVEGIDELPELAEGESYVFSFTYVNSGVIAAENVHIGVPEIEGYQFELGYNDFKLPAGSSVEVPVRFFRPVKTRLRSFKAASGTAALNAASLTQDEENIRRIATIYSFPNTIRWLCGGEWPEYVVPKTVKFGTTTKLKPSELPEVWKLFHSDGEGEPARSDDASSSTATEGFVSEIGICQKTPVDCNIPLWVKAIWEINPYLAPYRFGVWVGQLCEIADAADTKWEATKGLFMAVGKKILEKLAEKAVKSFVKNFTSVTGAIRRGTEKVRDVVSLAIDLEMDVIMDRLTPMLSTSATTAGRFAKSSSSEANSFKSTIASCAADIGMDPELLASAFLMERYIDYREQLFSLILGGFDISGKSIESVAAVVECIADVSDAGVPLSIDAFADFSSDEWTYEELLQLISTWNSSSYNKSEIRQVALKIDALGVIANELYGYESPLAMAEAALDRFVDLYSASDGGSVCASITLQFSQTLAMTREAFDGTLTMFNGNTTTPVTALKLDISVLDEEGNECKGLFEVFANGVAGAMSGGEDVLAGGLSVAAGGTGSAMVRFIPERGAAPTEAKVYRFGGTVTYVDPFSGETATVNLTPVSLTVSPSPYLHLDYFVQRDVYADDPFTLDVVEASMPAELSILIRNTGGGEARNVRISSVQPETVHDEKGLLAAFRLSDYTDIRSALDGSAANLKISDITLGNIDPGAAKVAQWWFTSCIEGHFTGMAATVAPLNSWNTPDTALVDPSVGTHKLVRSIVADGDALPDFLTSEESDLYGRPDSIYTAAGEVLDVHTATATAAALPNGAEIALAVTLAPARSGWCYGTAVVPGLFRYTIAGITRADGTEVPLRNAWITDRTFRDGLTPLLEERLHIVDDFASNESVAYTVALVAKPTDGPAVEAFEGVVDGAVESAVRNAVTVVFSTAVNPSTFTPADLSLSHQGAFIPDLSPLSVAPEAGDESGTRFVISGLAALCPTPGRSELTVQCAGIANLSGSFGTAGRGVAWTYSAAEAPYVIGVDGVPRRAVQSLDTVTVVLSSAIDPTTFTRNALRLNGAVLGEGVTIRTADQTGARFEISGLEAAQGVDGEYALSIDATSLASAADGTAGAESFTARWTRDTTAPRLVSLERETGLSGTRFILAFSEDVDEEDVTADRFELTKTRSPGGAALPATAAVTPLGGGRYAISCVDSALLADGAYTLTFTADGVSDEAGNMAEGTASLSWTQDTTPPDSAANLRISPDFGFSDSDGITCESSVTLLGTLPADAATVEVLVRYATGNESGTVLVPAFAPASTALSVPLSIPSAGNQTLVVRCADEAGNASETALAVYLDGIALTASLSGAPAKPADLANALTLAFSDAVVASDVSLAGFSLTRDGAPVPLAGASLATAEGNGEGGDATTAIGFTISGLSTLCTEDGVYRLAFDGTGVRKASSGRAMDAANAAVVATWTRHAPDIEAPHVFSIIIDGVDRSSMFIDTISAIEVVFSEPVNIPELVANGWIGQAVKLVRVGANGKSDSVVFALQDEVSWDEESATMRWMPAQGSIGLGNWRLSLDAGFIADAAGNALSTDGADTTVRGLVRFADEAPTTVRVTSYAMPSFGDFNGDGAIDLLVGEKSADGLGRIQLFRNGGMTTSGTPALSASGTLTAGGVEIALAAQGCQGLSAALVPRRYESNDISDLVVGDAFGNVRFYPALDEAGDGDGAQGANGPATPEWGEGTLVFSGGDEEFGSPRAVVAACDFLGFGQATLVVGGMDGRFRRCVGRLWRTLSSEDTLPRLAWLKGGDGEPLAVPAGRSAPAAFDLNGDGLPDLVSGDTAGAVWAFLADDRYSWHTEPIRLLEAGTYPDRSRVAIADFTGTGIPTLAVGRSDGSVRLHAGTASPSPAFFFTVTRTPPALATALDAEDFTWTTGGDAEWRGVWTDAAAKGGHAAQVGASLGENGSSWIETTFQGGGLLTFQWRLDGTAPFSGTLAVSFDGAAAVTASTDALSGWATVSHGFANGPHTVRWTWTRGAIPGETAWLDDVSWILAPWTNTTSQSVIDALVEFHANLMEQGLVDENTSESEFNAVALSDADGDGYSAWDEFVAGTDPDNPDSVLIAMIDVDEDGNPVITWTPDLNEGGTKSLRKYTVDGKANLADEWGPPGEDSRFFRVRVDLPDPPPPVAP